MEKESMNCIHFFTFQITQSSFRGFREFTCVQCQGCFYEECSKWKCKKCSAYICIKCKSAPIYDSERCPNGHSLEIQSSYLKDKMICSNCCKRFEPSLPHKICAECSFALCKDCNECHDYFRFNSSADTNKARGLQTKGMKISGEIFDSICTFELEFWYTNTKSYSIETSFKLPIDNSMSIVGVSSIINGKEKIGLIKPKNVGALKYTDSISSGDLAYLMTLENGFANLTMGNVYPNQNVNVKIKIVKSLFVVKDHWALELPTNLMEAGITGTIEMNVKCASEILMIKSETHEIQVKQINKNESHFKVNNLNYEDFWVQIYVPQINLPRVLVQSSLDKEESAVMLSFVPQLNSESTITGEYIFMLDVSGSMSGRPLELAKNACMMFLKSLPPKSAFNVYLFETSFKTFFSASVDYNQENLTKALSDLENTQSGGGTHLLEPIRDVFSRKPKEKKKRFIFILTDGCVEDKEVVINVIRKNSKNTTTFSIGIGNGVDKDLILRTAVEGKGTASFIEEGEEMTPKIINALSEAFKQSLDNVSIKWPENTKVIYSTECYSINMAEQFSYYAICKNLTEGEATFKAINRADGSSINFNFNIPKISSDGNQIFQITASIAARNYSLTDEEREKIALKNSLLTDQTSFILTEKQKEAAIEELKTIPIWEASSSKAIEINEISRGQERFCCMSRSPYRADTGRSERLCRGNIMLKGMARPCKEKSSCGIVIFFVLLIIGIAVAFYLSHYFRIVFLSTGAIVIGIVFLGKLFEKSTETNSPRYNTDINKNSVMAESYINKNPKIAESITNKNDSISYQEIVKEQMVEGYWTLDKIEKILSKKDLISSCPSKLNNFNGHQMETIWATLLALCLLKIKCKNYQSSWKLISDKGVNWLSTFGVKLKDYEKEAKIIISQNDL